MVNKKKISIGVFKSELMKLSKNCHLVLGDITFEFGPKVQVILSSMLASKSQAASVAFMFALIEVVTQIAVVFRNRFNGIMLPAAAGNNEKLVTMKTIFSNSIGSRYQHAHLWYFLPELSISFYLIGKSFFGQI